MKLVLTIAGIVLYTTCSAQINRQPYLQRESAVTLAKPASKPSPFSELANGNTVMFLPQDNMPCIIPKTEGDIPNAGAGLKNKNWGATIPNTGKKIIIPLTITIPQTHTDTLAVEQ